ncbi:MAG: precorrin-6y C5,15-methyltransferase (decarboxylating) subunit CbiE, partial [Xanthobacteraceae bacterium]
DAEIVFGGKRHLGLAAPLIRGAARPWPSPFERAVEEVQAYRGRQVCILASGDPFVYGVGAVLLRHVDSRETIAVPQPSTFSLAAARLGWALPETTQLSLHGRSLDLIRPHLQPGARVLALTSDGEGPAALARLLAELGFGASRMTVLEALGGSRERLRATTAGGFDLGDVGALNTVAVAVEAAPGAGGRARAAGLSDALFEHDGQITKREIRAITLSALSPRRGELLWDVGAGAGSVAIEWMLADPSMRAVAVEARGERAARIRRNAAAFGVPALEIVEGRAPAAFDGLGQPDAVFVGGGVSDAGLLDAATDALRPGGRLVVNAVTLEAEAVLLARRAGLGDTSLGGELTRIAIARAEPVGRMQAWRPAMPLTQWTWVKP